jgi:hypothetical protein
LTEQKALLLAGLVACEHCKPGPVKQKKGGNGFWQLDLIKFIQFKHMQQFSIFSLIHHQHQLKLKMEVFDKSIKSYGQIEIRGRMNGSKKKKQNKNKTNITDKYKK